MTPFPSRALHRWVPVSKAVARAYVVPHAGAGVAAFTGLAEAAADARVELVGIRLPGRENRFAEPASGDLDQAGEETAAAIADDVAAAPGELPILLVGQCSGAAVALAAARALGDAGTKVHSLVLVSFPEPSASEGADVDPQVYLTSTYEPSLIDNPEMREILTRVLDADLALLAGPVPAPPSGVPIVAVRGTDDEHVSAAMMATWQARTTAPFRLEQMPGGHLLAQTGPGALAALLRELVVGAPDEPGDHGLDPTSPDALAALWAEALSSPASPDTDYFDAGGSSVGAARLAARVNEVAGVRVPLVALFESPTPQGLSERIARLRAEADT